MYFNYYVLINYRLPFFNYTLGQKITSTSSQINTTVCIVAFIQFNLLIFWLILGFQQWSSYLFYKVYTSIFDTHGILFYRQILRRCGENLSTVFRLVLPESNFLLKRVSFQLRNIITLLNHKIVHCSLFFRGWEALFSHPYSTTFSDVYLDVHLSYITSKTFFSPLRFGRGDAPRDVINEWLRGWLSGTRQEAEQRWRLKKVEIAEIVKRGRTKTKNNAKLISTHRHRRKCGVLFSILELQFFWYK
jgi:hypothetical protein